MSAALQPSIAAVRAAARPSPWSRRLLRSASVIYVLYTLGHTLGGMLGDHHRGARQAELFAAMQDYTFPVQGVTRSYWDFYRGFGFTVSILLALAAVLSWMLGDMGRTHPVHARRLLVVLTAAMAGMTWFSFADFFAGPMIFSAVTTLLLALAAVALGRESRQAEALR